MAVMTKAEAKKFKEMSDKMIDVLNYLKGKGILDTGTHRSIMLKGFSRLVEVLEEKKVIRPKDAQAAMKGGFDSLLNSLAA